MSPRAQLMIAASLLLASCSDVRAAAESARGDPPTMTKRALVLVRTTRPVTEVLKVLASVRGVVSVDQVQGPYDLVVQTSGVEEIDIGQIPGVTHVEVCWRTPHPEGGSA